MKKLSLFTLVLGLLLYAPYWSQAQTTIHFEQVAGSYGYGPTFGDATPAAEPGEVHESIIAEGFLFTVSGGLGNAAQVEGRGNTSNVGPGYEGTSCITDNSFVSGDITKWTIKKANGDPFQFRSIYLEDRGNGGSPQGWITAYKEGVAKDPVSVSFLPSSNTDLLDFLSNSDFFDVDSIEITANDINFYLDEFTYGPPTSVGANDPAEVANISLVGSPASTATTVSYTVTFTKAATGVDATDFVLTKVGTATGTIASVTGSGTTYTAVINGISGEGSIRLDLKAGTNIENSDGTDGTAEFTGGQPHYVTACFMETFDQGETNGVKTFSGNGKTFTMTGNWTVNTESPVNGLGGSAFNLKRTSGTGPFTIAPNDGEITVNGLYLYLSSMTDGASPTGSGTVIIRGFRDGSQVYTFTKSTGFETNLGSNSGYTYIDFSAETGDHSAKVIDQLEISIGGAFTYLNLDNFSWCEGFVPPAITSSTYDAFTGELVVTGTDLLSMTGANNDIIANKFTFTGEGGATYTLTNTPNSDISSSTSFKLMLSAPDRAAVNTIMNKNGISSSNGTAYNLSAAEDWAAGADVTRVVADMTGNGITVSNVAIPAITAASYDAATGMLTVTGTGFLSNAGAINDIVANKFTLMGEGGATYTLTDTENGEISSGTSFTLVLSAADRAAVNAMMNKNGTSSTNGTTYNLAAAEDWAAGANAVLTTADTTGNGITVSNVAVPVIVSASYNAATGTLTVTGTGFLSNAGASNDIVANKFTLMGEGGATYTLTDTQNREINSGTSFTLALSATDRSVVNTMMNKNGTSSTDGTTYNLAAAEDWAAGASAAVVVADMTGNGITVSNVAVPAIVSASYDAATGTLTVTGTGFLSNAGATNDIVANKFTLMGEGGATYTLTDTQNGEISSGTSFTLVLSTTDRVAVNAMMNKNGTSSTNGTTYNLAAAEDWAAGADAAVVVADTTGNGITVSNVAVPTITSATYDAATGTLTITGTGFLSYAGASNDVVANKFTLMGEGGASYTLTNTPNSEISSGTSFTLVLSTTDRAAVDVLMNKNGTSSNDGITYNLAAAEDWAAGASAAVAVADMTGNGITASNVVNAPTDISLNNSSINQSAAANATVGTLSSADLDATDTHTYSLATGTGDDDNDDYNISGTSLRATDPSALSAGTNSIRIRTTDNTGKTYEKEFTITVVDDVAPTVSSVSVPANATYVAGQNLDFTVNVTENVTVTGTPSLSLTIGSTTVNATYVSGSTTSALTFRYKIQTGDVDTDGIAVTGTSLVLNGGTIRDGANHPLTLTLNNVGITTGILVDAVAPSVTSVDVPAADTYGIGESLSFTVNFDEAVTVTDGVGAPRILLTVGTATRYAEYQSGSGTSALEFEYTVVAGDFDADGIAVGSTIELNGGTVNDAVANAATLTLSAVGVTDDVLVDGVAPTVSTVSPANGSSDIPPGDNLLMIFSEDIALGTGNIIIYDETNTPVATIDVASHGVQLSITTNVLTINPTTDLSGLTTYYVHIGANAIHDLAGNPYVGISNNTTWRFTTIDVKPIVITSVGTTTFTESVSGGSSPVPIDNALTVTDIDNTTLASATVRIEPAGFQSGEDILAFVNDGSMGNIGASYDAGTGVLTLTSAGASATLVEWQAALRAITYSNNSQTPNTTNRTISFVANDGLDDGAAAIKTVAVQAVNNAPVITDLDGDAVTFIEAGTAILIDAGGDATVSDPDSPDFDGGNLSIAIVTNEIAGEDEVGIRNEGMGTGLIGVVGGDVHYGGTHFGLSTGGTGGVDLIVTFLPTATPAAVQALIRNLTYSNSNTINPSLVPRTIRITLNDGDGATSAASTVTVNMTGVNDVPTVTTSGGAVTFTEPTNGAPIPVVVDATVTVADPDHTTLASATVTIIGNFQTGEDVLAFVNDGGTMDNIAGNYNTSTGVLTLTSAGASATLAEWDAALQAVTYSNSSQNPSTATRMISFVVNDGIDASSPATKDINVVAVNSAPIAVDDEIPVMEDIRATGNVLTNDSDPEGNMLTVYLVTPPENGTVVLNSDGSFNYMPKSDYAGLDSLKYQVCDIGASFRCDTAWVYFTIEAVNDAPTITVLATVLVDEDVPTPLTGISFSDIDAGNADVSTTFSIPTGTLSATSGGGVTASGSGTGVLTLVGSIPDINAFVAAGTLAFTTALNRTNNVILTVGIDDGGNTGSDPGDTGTVSSEAATTMVTLRVIAVNDVPVNAVPVDQTIDQGSVLVFSTGNGNIISVSDVDAGGGNIQVTLTVTNGLTTLGGTTGLTFISGSGADDATMTFQGTIADINNALEGLAFMPTNGYNGAASIEVATDDLGASGSGGAQVDTDVIGITVNPTNPRVMGVGSTDPDGLYKLDDVITLTVLFDQPVTVDASGGSPTLLLETGSADREADYQSGSGTNTLTFSYTVQAGDASADLDYQSTAALTLNGATIQSASGEDAVLTLPVAGGASSIAGQHALVIDGVAPAVTSVAVPANGYYRTGDVLGFTVHTDDDVTVDDAGGTPYLEVMIGTETVVATYTGGTGSDALSFSYTVQAADQDLDGITVGGAINPNGGTILDDAGNDALFALNGVAPTDHVFIYSVRPSVTLSTGATSPVNAPFTVMATFSEEVAGFTLNDITVTNGTLSDLQTTNHVSYTFLVTPATRGGMQLSIASNLAVNMANNGNEVSNTLNVQFNEIIADITLEDGSFVYDGTAKSLAITGDLPDGTSVNYAGNSRTDVGTQEVTATISGDNYENLVLTADLTITATSITGLTLEDGSFVYDGTVKSLVITGDLPDDTNVEYGNNSRTDVGTQEVKATITGDNYETLVLMANLTITPATRSIDFPAIPAKTYGDADFDGGAAASSEEVITYTSSNPAVAEIKASGQIHITGAGTTTITATVPHNGNYSNRPDAVQVLTVGKATQAITFNAPPEVNRDAGSIQLDVTASSDLPVVLTGDDPEVATLDAMTLNILRLGTVRITAMQEGDANHEPAEPVTVTIRVIDPASDMPIRIHQAVSPNGDGINEYLIIEAIKDYPENRVSIFNRNGTVVYEASGYNNGTIAFRGIGTGQQPVTGGTYFYVAEINVDGEWKYEKGWFVLRY